jgi:hypothetical protein
MNEDITRFRFAGRVVKGGNMSIKYRNTVSWRGMTLGVSAPIAMAAMMLPGAAWAGSVTQPGETIGYAAGAPLPQGWYFADTTDYGQRTPPSNASAIVTIPLIVWATPYHFLGARAQALVAAPLVGAGTPGSYTAGWYNPLVAGQLAWDLGNGLGVSYLFGFYSGVSSSVADHSGSINQRVAISYTANGYNLTANLIYGNQISSHTNPNFLNLDLTATKAFGKWSFGPVGYYSTDTSSPFNGYQRQSQFALGLLVGYDFGPVIMQSYLTRGVTQSNYGGNDTRFWLRFIVPLA